MMESVLLSQAESTFKQLLQELTDATETENISELLDISKRIIYFFNLLKRINGSFDIAKERRR